MAQRDSLFEAAVLGVEKLEVLAEFPRSAVARLAVAEQIAGICASEQEIGGLIRELALSGRHSRWQGPGWLKQIYEDQFQVSSRPELQPYVGPETTIRSDDGCSNCQSVGWTIHDNQAIRCEACALGRAVPALLLELASGWKPKRNGSPIGRSGEQRLRDTLAIADGPAPEAAASVQRIPKSDIDAALAGRKS